MSIETITVMQKCSVMSRFIPVNSCSHDAITSLLKQQTYEAEFNLLYNNNILQLQHVF